MRSITEKINDFLHQLIHGGLKNELNDWICDIFNSHKAQKKRFYKQQILLKKIRKESSFGRNIWGMLSLELWHQEFHDKATGYKKLIL